MTRSAFKRTFLDTVPVMTGYLFLGAGLGILLSEKGYGAGWSFLMSLTVYAGSCQYLLVSLLASKAPLLTTAAATLLVNARHLFYGISMVDTYRDAGRIKPYLIFALTDETYSLVTQNKVPEGMSRIGYCFTVSVLDHCYWLVGCVLGSVAGALLPLDFKGVEFVLTALFVTMFVEQWLSTKRHGPAIIGVMSTVLCLLIFGKEVFLIPSMVVIALLLMISQKTGRRESHE